MGVITRHSNRPSNTEVGTQSPEHALIGSLGHLLGPIGVHVRHKSGAALSALPRQPSGRGVIRMFKTLHADLRKGLGNPEGDAHV